MIDPLDTKKQTSESSPFSPNANESASVASRIGPYKILQPLGEGGMGTVWEAEQVEPVRRRVALKLIKGEVASKSVLARFEAERQALALMDHPHIAKVLDAGTTQQGQPFFVMELVKGLPITKFCDQAKLTLQQRLELFIPVCHAIQHAHQKGIIHRDLKPSNILVGIYDGHAVPKVIDFGVAKALNQPLTERTLFTEMGMLIGTPEYMAPEQAEVSTLAIDTRADIYSLGVILYELLTSSTPFDRRLLQKGMFLEWLRLIREVEPPTPSQKLISLVTLAEAAQKRRAEPRQLSNLIKGELDWIVMKCLDKERDRRYGNTQGLAQDIERYLKKDVVLARPPSRAYRLKKYFQRNKGRVIAGILVALSLLGGLAGIWWGMVQADSKNLQPVQVGNNRSEAVPTRSVEEEINSQLKNGEVAGTISVGKFDSPPDLKIGDRVIVTVKENYIEKGDSKLNNQRILENVEVLFIESVPRSDRTTILLRLTRQQALVLKFYQDAVLIKVARVPK